MEVAWILRGFCEELNLFLFEREREGYKRFVACTVCGKLFLYIFWILFVMGLEQIPGINLQMSISAKVDNIMT